MNSSDIPSRIFKPFGLNGLKNTIPVDSSTTTDNNGVATFDKGFPPVTMQPLSAGGIPPSGKDMNGVLYTATLQQQWQNAGMIYPYDADFASAISGYPKGAVLKDTSATGAWLNTIDGNSVNPSVSSSGWVPEYVYGFTNLTGLTGGTIVLSQSQAAKTKITLAGELTSNLVIVFPAWLYSWSVINNCTGNYAITLKTVSGSGVAQTNHIERIYCDGVSIYKEMEFTSGSSSTGYWTQMPNGEIHQWGYIPATSPTAPVNIIYPRPFREQPSYTLTPTASIPVFALAEGTTATQINAIRTFTITGEQRTNAVHWSAIGY